jgi:hypothetical protein
VSPRAAILGRGGQRTEMNKKEREQCKTGYNKHIKWKEKMRRK